MALPVNVDLNCYKGQTYQQNLYFKNSDGSPYDLTEKTFTAQIRRRENIGALIAEMNCTVMNDGRLSLELTADETAEIDPGTYYWDLKTVEGIKVTYYIRGKFVVEGRVTV